MTHRACHVTKNKIHKRMLTVLNSLLISSPFFFPRFSFLRRYSCFNSCESSDASCASCDKTKNRVRKEISTFFFRLSSNLDVSLERVKIFRRQNSSLKRKYYSKCCPVKFQYLLGSGFSSWVFVPPFCNGTSICSACSPVVCTLSDLAMWISVLPSKEIAFCVTSRWLAIEKRNEN